MCKRILLLLFISVYSGSFSLYADEGMWMVSLIKKLNEADMQKAGLKLTADDIYNINRSSLKDAIVRLGGGFCTGEMISGEGLMLTNHHCAYDAVQEHSTVENDYLTKGFWAMTHDKELPNPQLIADFLVRVEDVTERVRKEVGDSVPEAQRTAALQKAFAGIIKDAADSNNYKGEVKSFFKGNEYYLFIYQTYRDVRLVGAPPSSIGKFGGDTDNWMWPRHTGDFSLFRVYMSKDGKPAEYNIENIPYKPKYFLPVSLEGFKEGDFAMTLGYPGSTDRYLTSDGIKLALNITNPAIIKIREKKLGIIRHDMDENAAIRIKYTAKYYESSNYYKYFIGQSKGLKRMKVAEKKHVEETSFTKWAQADPARSEKYGNVIANIAKNYEDIGKYALSRQYFLEAVLQGPEIMLQAYKMRGFNDLISDTHSAEDDIAAMAAAQREAGVEFYKNYNASTDRRLFAGLMKLYYNEVPSDQHPGIFKEISEKYKGNYEKYADDVYEKNIFSDSTRFFEFLKNPSAKKLKKDPAFAAMNSLLDHYLTVILPSLRQAELKNTREYRQLVAGLREMQPDRTFYPDANSTMRLSYGSVLDYDPMDAVHYDYFTTLEGLMEKKDNENDEFIIPAKLEELFNRKDYGRYGVNGKMNVCFITTNDITGGASGSPVINGKGELTGLVFDGNWEAMSGDIAYDPVYKRCINVDIRYVLFIIDKFAGATHLINEMKITGEVKSGSLQQAPASNY